MNQVGGRVCARCKHFRQPAPGSPFPGECHRFPAEVMFVPMGKLPNGAPQMHAQIYRRPAGPSLECGEWQQGLETATHLDLTKLQFPNGGLK